MKLNNAALTNLPEGIEGPRYDRAALTAGIVHIGLGNFHRAHQAWYLHRLMQQGRALGGERLAGGVALGDLGVGAGQLLPQPDHLIQRGLLDAVRWQRVIRVALGQFVLNESDRRPGALEHLEVQLRRGRRGMQGRHDGHDGVVALGHVDRVEAPECRQCDGRIGIVHGVPSGRVIVVACRCCTASDRPA